VERRWKEGHTELCKKSNTKKKAHEYQLGGTTALKKGLSGMKGQKAAHRADFRKEKKRQKKRSGDDYSKKKKKRVAQEKKS